MELRYTTEHQTRFAEENGEHFIEGYASLFDTVYFVPQEGFHERMDQRAFDRTLAKGGVIEARYNHSKDHPLGRTDLGTLKVWRDDKGLRYRIKYDPADPDHQKVKAKIASGLIKGSSFRFVPKDVKWERSEGKYVARIMDCEVEEVGPVNNPCSPSATVSYRSQDEVPSMADQFKLWQETQERLKLFNLDS